MKRTFPFLFLVATLLSAAASIALGQTAPAGNAPARGGGGGGAAAGNRTAGAGSGALNFAFYSSEFDTMTQQLVLTDDQKTKLQDRITTMNKEIDTFLANAPSQIAAGRRGARAGRAAANALSLVPPNPAMLKLQDDLQLLINEHQVIINQILTPEQRIAWEMYKLNRVLDPRLRPLALTDDQMDKVTTLINNTAQSLAALTDGKTVQELQGQLFRKIIADVLTDRQLGKFLEGALPIQGNAAARATAPNRAGPARDAATAPSLEGMP